MQSNCVAVLPHETPLGRKRKIDQISCNKDYSCVKGFCPSFVGVIGGTLRKKRRRAGKRPLATSIRRVAALPLPGTARMDRPVRPARHRRRRHRRRDRRRA